MPGPLFFYGTLRDLDLLRAVLGRRPAPGHLALGTAPGFRTVGHAGGCPALVRAPGGRAEGLVLLAITSFELDLLDAFEAGDYRRAPIPVIVEAELHEIGAYLPLAAVPHEAHDWSLAAWRETHKAGAPGSSPAARTRAVFGASRASSRLTPPPFASIRPPNCAPACPGRVLSLTNSCSGLPTAMLAGRHEDRGDHLGQTRGAKGRATPREPDPNRPAER